MSRFFLAGFAGVSRKGVIESFPVNVLRVLWQQPLDIFREISIAVIWHGPPRPTPPLL